MSNQSNQHSVTFIAESYFTLVSDPNPWVDLLSNQEDTSEEWPDAWVHNTFGNAERANTNDSSMQPEPVAEWYANAGLDVLMDEARWNDLGGLDNEQRFQGESKAK